MFRLLHGSVGGALRGYQCQDFEVMVFNLLHDSIGRALAGKLQQDGKMAMVPDIERRTVLRW